MVSRYKGEARIEELGVIGDEYSISKIGVIYDEKGIVLMYGDVEKDKMREKYEETLEDLEMLAEKAITKVSMCKYREGIKYVELGGLKVEEGCKLLSYILNEKDKGVDVVRLHIEMV